MSELGSTLASAGIVYGAEMQRALLGGTAVARSLLLVEEQRTMRAMLGRIEDLS